MIDSASIANGAAKAVSTVNAVQNCITTLAPTFVSLATLIVMVYHAIASKLRSAKVMAAVTPNAKAAPTAPEQQK